VSRWRHWEKCGPATGAAGTGDRNYAAFNPWSGIDHGLKEIRRTEDGEVFHPAMSAKKDFADASARSPPAHSKRRSIPQDAPWPQHGSWQGWPLAVALWPSGRGITPEKTSAGDLLFQHAALAASIWLSQGKVGILDVDFITGTARRHLLPQGRCHLRLAPRRPIMGIPIAGVMHSSSGRPRRGMQPEHSAAPDCDEGMYLDSLKTAIGFLECIK